MDEFVKWYKSKGRGRRFKELKKDTKFMHTFGAMMSDKAHVLKI